jgi:catechol 2,3-dioxygenase-like lactoylglutathione lyase family enzyme
MANVYPYSKEINHIGVSVPDLDKALDWYKKILASKLSGKLRQLELMIPLNWH